MSKLLLSEENVRKGYLVPQIANVLWTIILKWVWLITLSVEVLYDGNINLVFLPEYDHMINLTVQSMSITFPGIYLNIIVWGKVPSFGSDS